MAETTPAEQKERLRIYVSEAVGETRKVGEVRRATVAAQVRKSFKPIERKVQAIKKKYPDNAKKTVRVWYTTPEGRRYSERVSIAELERRVKSEKQRAIAQGLESIRVTTTIEEARPTTPSGVIKAAREAAKRGPLETEAYTPGEQHALIDILVSKGKLQRKVGPTGLEQVKASLAGRAFRAVSKTQRKAGELVEETLITKETLPGRFVKSMASGIVQAPFVAVKAIPGAIAGLDISIRKPSVVLPALIVAGKGAVFSFKTRPVETAGQVFGSYLAFRAGEAVYTKIRGVETPQQQLTREGIPGQLKAGKYTRGTLEQELTAPYKLEDIVKGVALEVKRGKARATPTVEYVYMRPVPPSELYKTISIKSKPYTLISSFTREGIIQIRGPPTLTVTPPTHEATMIFGQLEKIYGRDLAGKMVTDIEREGDVLGYVFKTVKTKGGKLTGITTGVEAEIGIEAGGKIVGGISKAPGLKQVMTTVVLPSGKRVTVARTIGLAAPAQTDLLLGFDLGGVGVARVPFPTQIVKVKMKQATMLKQGLVLKQATMLKQGLVLKQATKLKQVTALKQAQVMRQAVGLKQVTLLKQATMLKQEIAFKQAVALKMGLSLKQMRRLKIRMSMPSYSSLRFGVLGGTRARRKKVKGRKVKRVRVPKTFLAFPDPLSIFESELKYGKFTAPPQTRALRRRYRREVLFSPLVATFPTLEQLKAYKKKKKRKKKPPRKRRKKKKKINRSRRFSFL